MAKAIVVANILSSKMGNVPYLYLKGGIPINATVSLLLPISFHTFQRTYMTTLLEIFRLHETRMLFVLIAPLLREEKSSASTLAQHIIPRTVTAGHLSEDGSEFRVLTNCNKPYLKKKIQKSWYH